jgi:hypothetical protein
LAILAWRRVCLRLPAPPSAVLVTGRVRACERVAGANRKRMRGIEDFHLMVVS